MIPSARDLRRAVFLDRDGVINRKAPEGQYITGWRHFELLPGVAQAVRQFNEAGFLVIVVTNQQCVAKGLLTETQLKSIHRRMVADLKRQGSVIDAVYYCPHGAEAHCACRKPEPGMILEAARDYKINLAASWMVGDCFKDVQAGLAAGCKTAWITESGFGRSEGARPDLMVRSLAEAAPRLLVDH
ncbi:MAG TPA: HAD family hydrolase [Terriglobia bacterium]|nr:HAD family hydrolase [Terriglobia bacterium]